MSKRGIWGRSRGVGMSEVEVLLFLEYVVLHSLAPSCISGFVMSKWFIIIFRKEYLFGNQSTNKLPVKNGFQGTIKAILPYMYIPSSFYFLPNLDIPRRIFHSEQVLIYQSPSFPLTGCRILLRRLSQNIGSFRTKILSEVFWVYSISLASESDS